MKIEPSCVPLSNFKPLSQEGAPQSPSKRGDAKAKHYAALSPRAMTLSWNSISKRPHASSNLSVAFNNLQICAPSAVDEVLDAKVGEVKGHVPIAINTLQCVIHTR